MIDESGQADVSIDGRYALLSKAAALQTAGHLDEAAASYREILSQFPQDFDATHLLGVVALQRGQMETAQRLIHAALGINPMDTPAMANLGTVYMRLGQLESALQWFTLALKLQPESPTANTNIGTVLHLMGRHADAIPPLRTAYSVDPSSYAVCLLLGTCLVETGQREEAVALFEAAIGADPRNAEGWENLAMTLNALGRYERAGECAARALALKPGSSVALGALGKAQLDQGSVVEAIETYRQGASVDGPSAQMLAAYGSALLSNGMNDEAMAQFERAVALDGANLGFRWSLALAQLKPIYKSAGDAAASRNAFEKAVADVEAWYRQSTDVREPFRAVGIIQPFYIAYQPYLNRELLRRYGALCVSWMSSLPHNLSVQNRREFGNRSGSKIKIGIVSSHMHQHSVWNAITRGWVNNLDRAICELYLFKLDGVSDRETEKAKAAANFFEDRPTDLSGWIEAIRQEAPDVLIYPEIGMHPLTLQLACLRLAPVQAASWGHPETTGLPTIDLYLSGDAFEPPNASGNYTEKLVRLPNLGVYVEPLKPRPSKAGLGSLMLPSNEPLLLCPGAPFKYAPQNDDVWVQIAGSLKKKRFRWSGGGRLIFFRTRNDIVDKMFETRLRSRFEAAGVGFDERVSIIPALDRSRFFGLLRESALMLDTIGFSGFNTAMQAIECDLPVLAFEGEFMRGRLASAILRRLDLPELVSVTQDEFVTKAAVLAADAGRRRKLRTKIMERRSVLFFDLAPVRALEHTLRDEVERSRHTARP